MKQPIETVYNGYRFRSRLEAHWAVYFDAMGIEYDYEPEKFRLDTGFYEGHGYIPDFWLPSFSNGLFCEVKPLNGNFEKAWSFVETTGNQIWLCEGPPDLAIYWTLGPCTGRVVAINCGTPHISDARDENRMYWQPCFSCPLSLSGTSLSYYPTTGCQVGCHSFGFRCRLQRILLDKRVYQFDNISSIYAARQTRFEHSEETA